MRAAHRSFRDEFGDLPQRLVVPDPTDWPDAAYDDAGGWSSALFWRARAEWQAANPGRGVLPLQPADWPAPDEPFDVGSL